MISMQEQCTGCALCANICPSQAITMVEDQEKGHYKPKIDSHKCVSCDLCRKKCPANNETDFFRRPLHVFAAWQENDLWREGCSSGGVAATMYREAIERGFVVVGASWNGSSVELQIADTVNEAEKFKGSKYIQSKAGLIYKDCLTYMKQGKKMLFVGVPCQCAAFKAIIPKQYESECLIVELVCHGVPSPKMFADYIANIEEKKRREVHSILFRSVEGEVLHLLDKQGHYIWKRKHDEDAFLTAFNQGVLLNKSCYKCRYARPERIADLTIGDFWGIGREKAFIKPKNKVSLVLVNTEKGEDFFTGLCLHIEEREYAEALVLNTNLKHPTAIPEMHDAFYESYQQKGTYNALLDMYGKQTNNAYFKRRVKDFIKSILRRNKVTIQSPS